MTALVFSGYRLDVGARQLTRLDGSPVKLSSRAFDTLAVLVAQRGTTVTKRALLNAVWPDVVVGDNNLNQAIAALRRALGDNSEPRRIVQTVPGRGFCFVAELEEVGVQPHGGTECARHEPVLTVADYF